AMASPAYASGHGYVGFDAGLLMPDDVTFSYDGGYDYDIEAKLNNGFDLDIVGGYDFGFIRVEGELGWKRAKHDECNFSVRGQTFDPASAASAAPSAAATGDADVPGRVGNPCDGRLSATAAAASHPSGAGTRVRTVKAKNFGPGAIPGRFF